MLVYGDIIHGATFEPAPAELKPLVRVFAGRLAAAAQGFTLAEYNDVPSETIKGANYWGYAADKTQSFDTKQALLTAVQRGISNGDGSILDVSRGLNLGDGYTITSDGLGFTANHIPQLFSLIPNNVENDFIVIGFNGFYDFKTRLFRGQLEYKKYGEIWNAQQ